MNSTNKIFNQTSILVFIDAGVDNYLQLFDGVVPAAKPFLLHTATDGIQQIDQILQQYPGQKTVHIISHGGPGCLYLGNTQLSLDTLEHYAPQLQQWDIDYLLLYGCHVAAGDAGEEFVSKLRGLTGADIAGSKSVTGTAFKGGNWELEVKVGAVEFAAAFSSEVMATYEGVLALIPEIEANNSIANAQVIAPASFSLTYNSGIQTFDGTNISTTVPHVTIPGLTDGSADYYQLFLRHFSG